MSELKEIQRLNKLAVLEKHNLGLDPTYKELMNAQQEEKDFYNLPIIFEKQNEYIDSEIVFIKGQRKLLQNNANLLKYLQNGGHSFETIGFEMHIHQVIRVLNEKINHNNLYLGHRPHHIDEQLFYMNDDYSIEFFDGYVTVELHTLGDACNSFKETYDIAVKKLKAHIEQSEFLDEQEKEFYSIF